MLKYYYQWRYKRSQRVGAFKLPGRRRRETTFRVDLASYLSQDSVRGRHFDRFDLPRNRRRWLHRALFILALILLGWLVYESALAISSFRD